MSVAKYKVLLACIQMGNMTRAGAELGYTQSAISRMVTDLEEQWGVPLLIRSKKGVVPTREARQLTPFIRGVVEAEKRLAEEAESVKGNISQVLSIGAFASISVQVLPQILTVFQRDNLETKIQLRTGEYEEIERWIRTGEVDCGFLPQPVHKSLSVYPVVRDQLVAVLPCDHPCAGDAVYHIQKLSGEEFISLKEYADDEMARFWDAIGYQPSVALEANDDYAILTMIERGLGISILHDLIVDTKRFHVVKKPLDLSQAREIGFAYPASSPLRATVEDFLQSIRIWKNESGRQTEE